MITDSHSHLTRLFLLSLSLLPTLAQEAPTPASPQPQPIKSEITVIGTRTAMELDESPVSTSLVNRKELENRNIRQIDQALVLTEGVIALRSKGPGDNDFGLGLRGFAGRSGQNRTLILVDGQPMNNSYIGNVAWSTFSVSEMERVEVARGPFSSLYGGNAMGGVVNLITRPVEARQMELVGQLGNRETTNYSLRVADRFLNRLGVSFGYSRYQTGGYSPQEVLRTLAAGTTGTFVSGLQRWATPAGGVTYQVGERGRNWFHQEGYRLRGEYNITKNIFTTLQYMRQSRADGWDAYTSRLRDAQGNVIDNGAVLFDEGGVQRRLTVTPANFIGTPTGAIVHILQTQTLTTLGPRWNLRLQAGLNRQPNDWYVTPSAMATLRGGPGDYVSQFNRAYYGNAQATWQGTGQNLVFGYENRLDRASITGRTIANYALRENPEQPNSQAFGQAQNQASYVQYQRTLAERLNVVAGGRWDYWKAYEGGNQTGLTQPVLRYPDRSTNALTGKVAANLRLNDGWNLRASFGNAFRNPTIYDMYRNLLLSGVQFLANPNVEPERLIAVDFGLVKRLGNSSQIEITGYQNSVRDMIYRTTDFAADPNGNIRRLTNAGMGRTRGLELAARQQVRSWLRFQQSYTYANAIITENSALPATIGRRLPYVPRHTATYLVTAAKQHLVVTWAGRYVARTFSTDTNADIVTGVPGSYNPFFEMDVTATYQLNKEMALFTNADNLLDRRYYQFFSTPGRSVFCGFRFRWQ